MRRYLETLFRHKSLFLIPVLAVPFIALVAFLYAGKEYVVQASMWVEPSPIADPLTSSRRNPNEIESQAMKEWLATDSFRKEVMERVGLTEAIQRGEWPVPTRLQEEVRESGLDQLPGVRSVLKGFRLVGPSSTPQAMDAGVKMVGESIRISPEGNNLLWVRYVGKEPQLGTRILEESIALFNAKTLELRTAQAKLAIDFYAHQLQTQEQRAGEAANALQRFLELHPNPVPGQQRPAAEEAELESLRRQYTLEQTLYESTLRKLEQVSQTGEAAIAGRDQGFRMVDRPSQPESTGVTKRSIVMMIAFGLVLGTAIGLTPVLVLTWLDNTARTREDIEKVISTPLIAQVPVIATAIGQPKHLVRNVYTRSLIRDPSRAATNGPLEPESV